MSRFFRLIKYEFSKLAQRTTTKISILCIVLAILGANLYFMISQQNSGTDQDEWMSYNRVALSMAEENYRQLTSFTIYEEAQARQLQLAQADIQVYHLIIQRNIVQDSWQHMMIMEYYLPSMRNYWLSLNPLTVGEVENAEYHKSIIDRVETLLNEDDWRGFAEMVHELRLRNGEYMDVPGVVEIYEQALKMRLEYDIVPDNLADNWKNRLLSEYVNNKVLTCVNDNIQLTTQELQQMEADNSVIEYRLRTGTPPDDDEVVSPFTANVEKVLSYSWVLVLFIIVISAKMLAGEYSEGTLYMLVTSPFRRWKIWLAKFITCIFSSIFILIVMFLLTGVLSGVQNGFEMLGKEYLYIENNVLLSMPYVIRLLYEFLFCMLEMIMTIAAIFLLSTIFNSSILAIIIGTLYTTVSNLILIFTPDETWQGIQRLFLFSHGRLSAFFSTDINVGQFASLGVTVSLMLAAFAVMGAVSLMIFNKRDIV